MKQNCPKSKHLLSRSSSKSSLDNDTTRLETPNQEIRKMRRMKEKWWLKYGDHCPELQQLAIKILSQTCNGGSKYNLKKTLDEIIFEQGINPGEKQRLSEQAFICYNIQLQDFAPNVMDFSLMFHLTYNKEGKLMGLKDLMFISKARPLLDYALDKAASACGSIQILKVKNGADFESLRRYVSL